MKKIALAIAFVLSLSVSTIWAQGNDSGVRTIKVPHLARPLVEKWIAEYAKVEPGIQFVIAKGSQAKDNIDLNVVFGNQEKADPNLFSHYIVFFGEFAVLPITSSGSEAAQVLEGKHLNSKKLRQLFFLSDDFDEDVKKNKSFEGLTVYSGSNALSVAASFARHFGAESNSFRGKRIVGDDVFLNTAIDKDPLGVTFNALPNIFDLKSRHVKEGITLIGLDVKKDWEETLSNSGTLDDVLSLLEKGKPEQIAIERVGVSYDNGDDAVNRFLNWVLQNGTQFNHEYGLLNLSPKVTQAQVEKLKKRLTAQK